MKLRNEQLNKEKTGKTKAGGGKAIRLGLAINDGSLLDEKQEEDAKRLRVAKRNQFIRPEGEESELRRKRQKRRSPDDVNEQKKTFLLVGDIKLKLLFDLLAEMVRED